MWIFRCQSILPQRTVLRVPSAWLCLPLTREGEKEELWRLNQRGRTRLLYSTGVQYLWWYGDPRHHSLQEACLPDCLEKEPALQQGNGLVVLPPLVLSTEVLHHCHQRSTLQRWTYCASHSCGGPCCPQRAGASIKLYLHIFNCACMRHLNHYIYASVTPNYGPICIVVTTAMAYYDWGYGWTTLTFHSIYCSFTVF